MDERTRHRARLRAATIALAALLAALGAGSAHAVRGASVEGELLVGFRPGVSAAEQRAVLARAGAAQRRRFGEIRAALVSANEGALERLRADPHVRYAEPNYVLHADVVPNDPFYGNLWGLANTGQPVNSFFAGAPDADIDADEAWNVTTGRAGVIVALIDTGIDLNHPDLAPNLWTNPGESCDRCKTDGVDNDGNGYVDDWRGWDWFNHDGDPTDDQGHGTHVAGTIAAVGNNGIGVVGVAWNVRVMPLKFLGADGSGSTDDAISAILYAADKGAAVLNNSWSGGDYSQALRDAIGVADQSGALFVAAAGNDASDNDAVPAYPSSYDAPNLISVAASDNGDEGAWFSNFGKASVDLAAPGVDVYSTTPGGGYNYASGTSMAAPHVAGAAALAFSAFPSATPVGVKALLMGMVDPKPSLDALVATGGRLNAGRAVACSNQPQVVLDRPAAGFDVDTGISVPVQVLAAACGQPGAVTVSATLNGAPLALTPRGDGLHTGTFTPTTAGAYTLTVTASAGGATATTTVTGAASTVYPISPGGAPVTVTATLPGQTQRLAFTGTAGQRVSLRLSDGTLGRTLVTFLAPNGAPLDFPASIAPAGGFIDAKMLPADGAYGISVEPASTATGSVTLTLYDVPPDASGTIVPGGPPATVTTTVPGQNARFTFAGAAGQRVSMKVSGVSGTTAVTLRRPDGAAVGPTALVGSAGSFVDTKTLPVDGTYSIVVDPSSASTGSVTVTLYDVPDDVSGVLSFGTSVSVATTVPGQNVRLSFDARAGGRISVALAAVTFRGTVSILRPDGAALGSTTYVGSSGAFVDTRTVPVDGRYTVVVDPMTDAVGSASLTLYDVPPDVEKTISFADPATVTMTVPGQGARLAFVGKAGGRVSVNLTGVSIASSRVSLVAPNGVNVGSTAFVGTAGAFIEPRTLPVDGTYAVVVDPQQGSIGSMTVTAYDVPADVTGSLTLDAQARVVTFTTPGQNARLTFEGTSGARVTLKFSAVTVSQSYISVFRPNGSTLQGVTLVSTSGKTLALTLPETGTYTLVVDPRLAWTGSMSVTLSTTP